LPEDTAVPTCRPVFAAAVATVALLAAVAVAPATAAPPDAGEYVTVKDGHLSLHGKRVRYWAAIGKTYLVPDIKPGDTPEQRRAKVEAARRATDAIIDRLDALGFNAVRFWDTAPNQEGYTPGDGSRADAMDYALVRLKAKGFKVWCAGLNDAGTATPDDAGIVGDPTTADAWKAAVAASGGQVGIRNSLARVWDPRLEAVGIRAMKAVASHTNKHTGLRWADDPVFGAWELSNEEWWMPRMLGGQWQQLPPFFRNQLLARWNGWLAKKYGTDAKLRAAWGALLPGEGLAAGGSVLLAPMGGATSSAAALNDANPVARAALTGLKQEYRREDFSRRRGEDVIAFLLDLQLAHKRREAAAVKSWGRSTKLCPLVYDTGIGYQVQSQYLHQVADAVAHDAYVNGTGPAYEAPDLSKITDERARMYAQLDKERISANAGPWVNWLLKPPGISQGVPWLEHNRVEGKPFFCYETQIQQPAKYRADFPLRVAALAAVQDWDWVCWHYFSPGDDTATDPRPYDRPMDITTGGHPQGYHFTYDEVQNAMMRAAGRMFRGFALAPAPHPTVFVYGRKSLYDPESMEYGGSYGAGGMDMLQTVYQYGVRVRIDPSREDDQVIGPVVKFADRNTHNPYAPTGQIAFDHQKGCVSLDAPGAASWAGLLANHGGDAVACKNSRVTLRDVSIVNPAGIYDPVRPDEKYVAFSLYSEDGAPLEKTRRASLSLVSTSFNTGFKLAEGDKPAQAGGLPVLAARVGATVEAPALAGMRYRLLDWHFQELGAGTVGADGRLAVPADKPVFVVELTRP
jgi:hypothetical protein